MSTDPFRSVDELREVVDAFLEAVAGDADLGSRARDARISHQIRVTDADLILQVRSGAENETANLAWGWPASEQDQWPARVRLAMSSAVLNRYFSGRENLTLAVARRRIRVTGDVAGALLLIPLRRRAAVLYGDLVRDRHPHLAP